MCQCVTQVGVQAIAPAYQQRNPLKRYACYQDDPSSPDRHHEGMQMVLYTRAVNAMFPPRHHMEEAMPTPRSPPGQTCSLVAGDRCSLADGQWAGLAVRSSASVPHNRLYLPTTHLLSHLGATPCYQDNPTSPHCHPCAMVSLKLVCSTRPRHVGPVCHVTRAPVTHHVLVLVQVGHAMQDLGCDPAQHVLWDLANLQPQPTACAA